LHMAKVMPTDDNYVQPFDDRAKATEALQGLAKQHVVKISELNPDLDGDGQVAPWESDVYEKIKKADQNGDGTLTRPELFACINEYAKGLNAMAELAHKGGIPIESLNPDSDGDGKVEKWEVDVYQRIQDADADKSGVISTKELFGVIKGAAESDRQKKLFRKLFIIACILLAVMLAANMGLTFAVVFLAKDTKASGGELTTLAGDAMATAPVASYGSIFDLPAMSTGVLAELKEVTVTAEKDTLAPGATWPDKMEACLEVASATKPTVSGVASTNEAYLTLAGGGVMYLNQENQAGTLTMQDGSTFTLGGASPDLAQAPEDVTIGNKGRRQLGLGAGGRRFLADGVSEYTAVGHRRLLFSREELMIADPLTGRRQLSVNTATNAATVGIDGATASTITTASTTPPASAICTELCRYSGDNYCDDGGSGQTQYCAFGSDCKDCGPRPIPLPPPSPPPAPPSPQPPGGCSVPIVDDSPVTLVAGRELEEGDFLTDGGEDDSALVPSPKSRHLVTGGSITADYSLPYQVTIQARILTNGVPGNFMHACGGALIGPKRVLTAASCFPDPNRDLTHFFVGVYRKDLSKTAETETDLCAQDIMVEKLDIHPNYNKETLLHDIAIVTLKKAAKCSVSSNTNFKPGMIAGLDGTKASNVEGKAGKSLLDDKVYGWSGSAPGVGKPKSTYGAGFKATVSGWGVTASGRRMLDETDYFDVKLLNRERGDDEDKDPSLLELEDTIEDVDGVGSGGHSGGHANVTQQASTWAHYTLPDYVPETSYLHMRPPVIQDGLRTDGVNVDKEGGMLEVEHMTNDHYRLRNGTEFNSWDELSRAANAPAHRCGSRQYVDADDEEFEVTYEQRYGVERRRHLSTTTNPHCTSGFTNPHENYDPVTGDLYKIRVVFHIITNGAVTASSVIGTPSTPLGYMTTACIDSGIEMLNKDFRGAGYSPLDTTWKGAQSPDTGIEFVIADTNPNGVACANGKCINYINDAAKYSCSKKAECLSAGLYDLAWDPKRYLNVYLKSPGGLTLGYASFPFGSAGSKDDGMVVKSEVWGPAGCATQAGNQGGATMTHEVGHYLGLHHTFSDKQQCGDNTFPMCNQEGDMVCDTPTEYEPIYNCQDANSCGSADPIHNYMDYSDDLCLTKFTRIQALRMRCSLHSYRPGIMTAFSRTQANVRGAPSPPLSRPLASPPPLEFIPPMCKCNSCGKDWTYSGVTGQGCFNPDNSKGPWCFIKAGCVKDGIAQTKSWYYCDPATECFPPPPPAPPSAPIMKHMSTITCLPQMSHEACEYFDGANNPTLAYNKKYKTCFGAVDGGYGTDTTDIGAPLTIPLHPTSRSIVVGIVSYGTGTALAGQPTVFTKVAAYTHATGDPNDVAPLGAAHSGGKGWIFQIAPEIECMHACPVDGCTELVKSQRTYAKCKSCACNICNVPYYSCNG